MRTIRSYPPSPAATFRKPAPWPIGTTSPNPPPTAAPLLALVVDVRLAEGKLAEAAAATDRLAELAEDQPGPYLNACAALAKGRPG